MGDLMIRVLPLFRGWSPPHRLLPLPDISALCERRRGVVGETDIQSSPILIMHPTPLSHSPAVATRHAAMFEMEGYPDDCVLTLYANHHTIQIGTFTCQVPPYHFYSRVASSARMKY